MKVLRSLRARAPSCAPVAAVYRHPVPKRGHSSEPSLDPPSHSVHLPPSLNPIPGPSFTISFPPHFLPPPCRLPNRRSATNLELHVNGDLDRLGMLGVVGEQRQLLRETCAVRHHTRGPT